MVKNRHYLENRTSTTEQEKTTRRQTHHPRCTTRLHPTPKTENQFLRGEYLQNLPHLSIAWFYTAHPETQELNVKHPIKGTSLMNTYCSTTTGYRNNAAEKHCNKTAENRQKKACSLRNRPYKSASTTPIKAL